MAVPPSFTKVADGNVSPSRFVSLSTTVTDRVTQTANNSTAIYGVSQPGVRNAPLIPTGSSSGLDDGFAAVQGDTLKIYGAPNKDVLLQLGGTVTMGDYLTSDGNGKGVTTTTTGQYIGGRAMESGVTDDLIRVELFPSTQY